MNDKQKPLVSIILLNHNGLSFLQDCIGSVLRQDYSPFEVILVDNASTDGSVAFVREKFPSVRVVELEVNHGFAGGNNLGVRYASGAFIVLLNNDVVVSEGWLQGLVEAVSLPHVAIASSLVKTQGIPDRYYEKNGSINFLSHNIMRVFSNPEEIFYAGGASLIYKKNILGEPFDPEYFAYGEDVYLSLRARFLGYDIRHSNASRVIHYGNATAKEFPASFVTYLQERNRILNTLLFFSRRTIIKCLPFLVINFFGKLLSVLIERRYSTLGILRAHGYFISHWRSIKEKRSRLRADFRVDERDIIQKMSGRISNGEGRLAKILDLLSLFYCRVVGLRTIELCQTDKS